MLFFYFLKKESSKFISSTFERNCLEEKLTYLYFTNFQYLSVHYFNCLQHLEKLHKYIGNCATFKKKEKLQRKMSHITVCKTCKIIRNIKFHLYNLSCVLKPFGGIFINPTTHSKRFYIYFVNTKISHKWTFIYMVTLYHA